MRRSQERGHFHHGWLKTFHTFSFAEYFDPNWKAFRCLRVLNEDWVAPGQGFSTHEHRDMEILTYVLEGTLAHKDSLGSGSQIKPGDVQRMSAGRGISHSEFNASKTDPVHLLQIWLMPQQKSTEPSYEQTVRNVRAQTGEWLLLASPDGRDGSVRVGQDVLVWGIAMDAGQETILPLPKNRYGWVQIARGETDLAGFDLKQGDGASVEAAANLDLHAKVASEILFFDLP